jgi:hypothetical protein
LTPQIAEPACAESGYITAETANSVYGFLPAITTNTFDQSFTVTLEERDTSFALLSFVPAYLAVSRQSLSRNKGALILYLYAHNRLWP